ncbi:hypothetical protein [Streptomyces sp. NBC_00239]|uniref:hypothetical protein n=1 Tax=Streptomyces sp. NBC_00239 TaxID=2903640 RepID=UPI002E295545|nr:hypothetical protein [Streptomyces sp. NBC_00239]
MEATATYAAALTALAALVTALALTAVLSGDEEMRRRALDVLRAMCGGGWGS